MQIKHLAPAALALIVSTALTAAPPRPAAAAQRPQLGTFGIDTSGMDRAVAPGDDFYRYVNGGWEARTVIPPDQSRWGAFLILRDQADARTRAVAEAAAANPDATPTERKVGQLYAAFMDEATIERLGTAPLRADLTRIAAIAGPADLATAFARANRTGVDTPIGIGVTNDDKDPDTYLVAIGQGGLGLPDRDYYLDTANPRFAEARAAYQGHVARMLTLAGVVDASAKAASIMALETAIAQLHWSRVESRQAEKGYNPIPVARLAATYPGMDWAAFLATAGVAAQPNANVSQPTAIAGLSKLIAATPIDTWKAYLAFHTASARASVLPKAFVDEDFAFQKVLSGQPEQKARWKRAVGYVNASMGEGVGQLWVARYFTPDAKAKADALVRNVLVAMKGRLEQVTWMAPATKATALAKLASFRPKIGYPDKWRDYSALTVVPGEAYANRVRAIEFDYDYDLHRLGHPADRGEWLMTPQTVNAYANPVWNEVVFPAAILQPPFFDPNADPAVNYGAFGSVIGHEISHHFDDQGRKYDAKGRLADWWTAEDVTRFKAYTDRVVAQYAAYEPLPGVHVNGELTLGENMADLAGVNVAHDAWLLSLHGKPAATIEGFTGEQRFFLGFGQVWRGKTREASLLRGITTDPHTPEMFRPYVVRNVDAWYKAFDVKPGQKFYLAPDQRIKVW